MSAERFPVEFRHLPRRWGVGIEYELQNQDFATPYREGFPKVKEFLSKHGLSDMMQGTSAYFVDMTGKKPQFVRPGRLVKDDAADVPAIQAAVDANSKADGDSDPIGSAINAIKLLLFEEGEWAVTTVKGSCAQLPQAWQTALDKISSEGKEVDTSLGPCYDFYVNHEPDTPEEELITLVHIPVKAKKEASSSS